MHEPVRGQNPLPPTPETRPTHQGRLAARCSHAHEVVLVWVAFLLILGVNLYRFSQPGTTVGELAIKHGPESVGRESVEWGSAATPVPIGPLDLNQADGGALISLPGIGPSLAAAIVLDRQQHGPFASLEDLARVPGIGPARVQQLAGQVTCGSTTDWPLTPLPSPGPTGATASGPAAPLCLNTAGQSELMAIPGIGETYAGRILQRREELGGFKSWEELLSVPGIGKKRLENLQRHARINSQ